MPDQAEVDLREQTRELAEQDLYTFACLVQPNRVYGEVHKELFRWWTREDAKDNQLVLLPRDHQKSHCMAVRVAWHLTKNPDTTILYVSATSGLAVKQLYAIKNIITSPTYRRYWPDMVNRDKGKRELWNQEEICVDHPKRKEEGVRDSTIKAAGLTTNITGFHAQVVVLDDIVVPGNAYTEEGRSSVRALYSQLSSVETTDAKEWVVGTRYHPNDIYADLLEMEEEVFNKEGEIVDKVRVYEDMQRVVEEDGNFLWPREARSDGKFFGFDDAALARKRAKYLDKTQFYAQYYNDPNDPESHRMQSGGFDYYDSERLSFSRGQWLYHDQPLSIFAAADLAYTTSNASDYTAIVVVGVDPAGFIYVLDMKRFKTSKYEEYYTAIRDLYQKWLFPRIRIETISGGKLVAEYLKDRVREEGGILIVDEKPHYRGEGKKEERIAAILEPRYHNNTIKHCKGGLTNVLEEELVLARPRHDDLKDALAAAVEISRPPLNMKTKTDNVVQFHSRFGGVIR